MKDTATIKGEIRGRVEKNPVLNHLMSLLKLKVPPGPYCERLVAQAPECGMTVEQAKADAAAVLNKIKQCWERLTDGGDISSIVGYSSGTIATFEKNTPLGDLFVGALTRAVLVAKADVLKGVRPLNIVELSGKTERYNYRAAREVLKALEFEKIPVGGDEVRAMLDEQVRANAKGKTGTAKAPHQMTVKELKKALVATGAEVPADAKKAELVDILLKAGNNVKAAA